MRDARKDPDRYECVEPELGDELELERGKRRRGHLSRHAHLVLVAAGLEADADLDLAVQRRRVLAGGVAVRAPAGGGFVQ